jgi:hypothetical protein
METIQEVYSVQFGLLRSKYEKLTKDDARQVIEKILSTLEN